jgi:hypothetical protein
MKLVKRHFIEMIARLIGQPGEKDVVDLRFINNMEMKNNGKR